MRFRLGHHQVGLCGGQPLLEQQRFDLGHQALARLLRPLLLRRQLATKRWSLPGHDEAERVVLRPREQIGLGQRLAARGALRLQPRKKTPCLHLLAGHATALEQVDPLVDRLTPLGHAREHRLQRGAHTRAARLRLHVARASTANLAHGGECGEAREEAEDGLAHVSPQVQSGYHDAAPESRFACKPSW